VRATLASESSCSCLIFISGGSLKMEQFRSIVDFGLYLNLGHSLSEESPSKMAPNNSCIEIRTERNESL